MPEVAVIVTVLDAGEELDPLIDGLLAQHRFPDQLVVVDGGSTDGTLERLHRFVTEAPFEVQVLRAPGAGISAGRNVAIRAATHDRIAVTDAGCRPDPGWLAALAGGLERADFVCGVYRVVGENAFETALSVALYPDVAEIGTTRLSHRLFGRAFAASEATGRSMAFTRAAYDDAGGFPETVAAGEDTFFARAVAHGGATLVLAPAAVVDWRPRPGWSSNARMYRGYARGDVALGRPYRHAIRFGAWVGFAAGWASRSTLLRAGGIGWLAAYCWLPAQRARRRGAGAGTYWRIPLVIAMKDAAMMAGALDGLRDARKTD